MFLNIRKTYSIVACGPQSFKYVLLGSFQKEFAGPCTRKVPFPPHRRVFLVSSQAALQSTVGPGSSYTPWPVTAPPPKSRKWPFGWWLPTLCLPGSRLLRLGHLTAVVSCEARQGMSLGKPSSPQKPGGGGLELGVPWAGG